MIVVVLEAMPYFLVVIWCLGALENLVECKVVADATAELIWIQVLLRELRILQSHLSSLWCDNIGDTYLVANPIFHR
jgi:hypothetical protein